MKTCLEWARMLRGGTITSVEITERYLERIARLDPQYGAYRLVTGELALSQARAADAAFSAGVSLSPLQGVPYAAKDLFDVAGLPTTAGCDLLAHRYAATPAAVIEAMNAAGMVLLGKTNLVQFAHGSVGSNLNQGTPRNPWSRAARAPGGSSSGSTVAVATGMAPIALGTDTGGSARVPPALCGVIGLKTTYGRISRAGVYPLSTTLDSVGIIGIAASDIAALLGLLSPPSGEDPSGARLDACGLRLAFADSLFANVDEDVAQAVLQAGATLGSLGACVSHIPFGEALQATALNPDGLISTVEGYTQDREYLESGSSWLDQTVVRSLARGATVAATDYVAALHAMAVARVSAAATMAPYDALLAPTTVTTAVLLAEAFQTANAFNSANAGYAANTHAANILGLCALTVPCGLSRAGLPIGLQIIGKPGDDERILEIGRLLVQASYHGTLPASPLLPAQSH